MPEKCKYEENWEESELYRTCLEKVPTNGTLQLHCDVSLGSIVSRSKDIYQRLSFAQRTLGPVPSPFDCYLVCRGLKTLPVRMRQHEKNALDIACFLEGHPMVKKVLYPGLESHPQHDVAKKQ
ncbi:cystathionine gamma-lyase-like [Tachypleus tridentatus]|uniref:cystathionine gamma-lyase-like n=1 Tax=Tachypleus tridentatus TaxID=6853 RepID=UPI003FD6417C